jgi:predicted XRE-type DNA-binding protein
MRGRLASDRPGEYHLDQIDYTAMLGSMIRQSHRKYSHLAVGAGVCPSTVSNLASGKTKRPSAPTLVGVTVSLGMELIIRGEFK